jgi:probable blue pigment (indigoidine) exporter
LKKLSGNVNFIILGIVFAFFWASASVSAKIGVKTVEPLMLFQIRFLLAGVILLVFSAFKKDWRWPSKSEIIALSIFGILNVTIYLSLFVLAIKEVASGIGSLAVSLGPVMISILSGLLLGKKIKKHHFFGLAIGVLGVYLAVIPLLTNSFATVKGLVYLFLSMISYSLGSIYFAKKTWLLPRLAINGWQVLLGGIFLLPLTFWFKQKPLVLNSEATGAIIWLTIPVSILAVNLWLKLVKIDTIKASFFMFLCPIFGFMFSSLILNEPFTWHTAGGLILVLISLYFGQKK